jgi:hypothetical protein
MQPPAPSNVAERVRQLEIQMATVMSQQANATERLEEVRDELRYVKRSLLALVFTILGGIAVVVIQSGINGFG